MAADFDEILTRVLELLASERRVSYRALKRRFGIDDEFLEDLKEEIIEAKRLAVDENGKVLVALDPEPVPAPAGRARTAERGETATAASGLPDLDAERRQLTVMFCDLADSTALSGRLDMEELREVIRAYQKTCVEVIARDEGHVAQYLGDGLLVYFGYPKAHEDDPQRAVRAGLGIVSAMRRLNDSLGNRLGIQLAVRLGIHTGPVVVGEVGSGGTREQLALGETPNVAARLQGLAELNTVVVSRTTNRLVGEHFDCESIGKHQLKGVSEPTEVFMVRGARRPETRAEARRADAAPLVGREREMQTLQRLWQEACADERRAVLVLGEAGIGKSRLTSEIRARADAEDARILLLQCTAYAQQSALFPMIDLLRQMLGLLPDDSTDARLDKLEAWCGRFGDAIPDSKALLAALLSLPTERYPRLDLSPQKLRQRMLELLVAMLDQAADGRPTLLIWEDLHWADPTSLELIDRLAAPGRGARRLLILTSRPDFEPSWRRGRVTEIPLERLSGAGVEQIIARVARSKSLPAAVVRELAARADGVPLFLEELTKNLLETDALAERSDRYELAQPLEDLGIPLTLRDSLMSRLDRLPHGKRLAQIGSAIGREFADSLIRRVWPEGEAALRLALQELEEADLVQPQTDADETIWVFKHALIQDAAYRSLLRSTRREYHSLIAGAIQEIRPETVDTQPELLANHYAQADQKEQAIDLFRKAGQKAIRASANLEAIQHLARGLELLRQLPESAARDERILGLLILMVGPQLATKGYGAPEVGALLDEARTLSQQAGDTPQLFQALVGLWGFVAVRGDLPEALAVGERLIGLAETLDDAGLMLEALLRQGIGLGVVGRLEQARDRLELSLSLYDGERHRGHAYQYGQDPEVCCRCVLALVLWLQGFPDRALEEAHEAVRQARALDHAFSLAWAHLYAGDRPRPAARARRSSGAGAAARGAEREARLRLPGGAGADPRGMGASARRRAGELPDPGQYPGRRGDRRRRLPPLLLCPVGGVLSA